MVHEQDNEKRLAPSVGRAPLWDRLNMDQVARRVIETARLATAEHALGRLRGALSLRDQGRPAKGE